MHKWSILASVVALAASCVNCANLRDETTPAFAPSAIEVASASNGIASQGAKGKPDARIDSSLRLVVYTDINEDGRPNWGDTVTFDVLTTATVSQVSLECFQNDLVVYNAFSADTSTPLMLLSSEEWPSGAADCTATLFYSAATRNIVLASTNFTADE